MNAQPTKLYRLQLYQQGQLIREYELNNAEFYIGNSSLDDLRLDIPQLSPHHARLIFNGTTWNFEELIPNDDGSPGISHPLKAGDQFKIGSYVLRLSKLKAGEVFPPLYAPPLPDDLPISDNYPRDDRSNNATAPANDVLPVETPSTHHPVDLTPPVATLPADTNATNGLYLEGNGNSAQYAEPVATMMPAFQTTDLPQSAPFAPGEANTAKLSQNNEGQPPVIPPPPPAASPNNDITRGGAAGANPAYDPPGLLSAQSNPESRPATALQETNMQPRATAILEDANNDGIPDAVQAPMVSTGEYPELQIISQSQNQSFPLKEDEITLGRTPENDIVIPAMYVSREHAILRRTDTGYKIFDNVSTNGLQYLGRRVKEVDLHDGTVVRIGDQLGNVVNLVYRDSSRPATLARHDIEVDPALARVTIGRASNNTIILNYPTVSAYHAVIDRAPNGVTVIRDLNSANGTFLKNRRIRPGEAAIISEGDQIQIASYQLRYHTNSIGTQDTSLVRIDALNIGKSVNNGKLTILNNISLSIQPKEFIALIGGSGTGKSTLLDALNGFRPAPQGKVYVNGEDYYENFDAYRTNLGYVPQDDIIHRELPVERALYYVAKMRLPTDTTNKEIEKRIAEVLEDVDMTDRRKVLVNRLSGGQRKRVSIAVELLANPTLFFLDEPTSGLDPGLDKRMMQLLRRLADQGRTIILITHATTNIVVCDKVAFLAPGGRLCFFGPPREALAFFEVDDFADIYSVLEDDGAEWERKFQASSYYVKYVLMRLEELPADLINQAGEIPGIATAAADSSAMPTRRKMQPGSIPQALKVSGFRQFGILCRRYFELVRRDTINFMVLLAQAPIIGVILAFVAGTKIFENFRSPANSQQVLFVLAIAAVWLGCSNAAREITKETPIYMRERLVNLRVFPYVMSKVAVLSLLCLVQSIMLSIFVLWLGGLPPQGALIDPAVELVIGVFLTIMAGLAIGLLISSIASNTDKAASIVPIILVPQIILGGVIFNLSDSTTKYLSWVTVSKWSMDSLGTTADLNRQFYQLVGAVPPDYKGNAGTFDPTNYDFNPSPAKYNITPQTYPFKLGPLPRTASQEFDLGANLLVRWGVLIGMFILFIALTCYFQKRRDKAWQQNKAAVKKKK